ncbi:MAG: hypothetical protein KAX51_02670 [Chromatiaceae bacterium]|nr:hypothetical protein [Chromatiaceae bacterium]MBP8288708.1 hypothetical protein [Chromatiaceae bacterium]MBP9603226.1 hypothetical protein [Chromatiaceae bacterium]
MLVYANYLEFCGADAGQAIVKSIGGWLNFLSVGPEGGDGGGRIVAQGSLKDIAANPDSVTGSDLRQVLMKC